MKKYILLLAMTALIAGCSNEATTDTSNENEDSEEVARLKEENEELKRQQEEQEKDQDSNEAQGDRKTETSNDEEDSTSVESTESENNDRSALIFDIDSPEVQAYINKNGNYDDEGNFIQDAITIGMTQNEVENKFGPYDFTIESPENVAAVYENLAIYYDHKVPFGDGTNGSRDSINPNNNKVEMVLYFSNLSEQDLFNIMGTPAEQLTNLVGAQNYIYKSNDGWPTVMIKEQKSTQGERVGLLFKGENDGNQSNSETIEVDEDGRWVTTEPNPEAEIQDEDRYEYLLTEYLQRLTAHYNNPDGFEDVYYYLRRGSAAYDKIAANKASGNFTGHETESVEVIEMTDLGDGTVKLNANRVYSHDNSNGRRIANVDYIVNAETNEIIDFQQVSDEAY